MKPSQKITKVEVEQIAKLANLSLSPDEVEKFPSQLEESLEYVENLQEIDTSQVPENYFTTPLKNVLAEDIVDESIMLTQAEALKNVKNTKRGYFVVKRIIHES